MSQCVTLRNLRAWMTKGWSRICQESVTSTVRRTRFVYDLSRNPIPNTKYKCSTHVKLDSQQDLVFVGHFQFPWIRARRYVIHGFEILHSSRISNHKQM